jgi:hypothetical protein
MSLSLFWLEKVTSEFLLFTEKPESGSRINSGYQNEFVNLPKKNKHNKNIVALVRHFFLFIHKRYVLLGEKWKCSPSVHYYWLAVKADLFLLPP